MPAWPPAPEDAAAVEAVAVEAWLQRVPDLRDAGAVAEEAALQA